MNKPLTTRQAEVLDLLNSGKTPKQVAEELGITDTGVYATRRRLVIAGHLPGKPRRASGRKRRGLSPRGAATVKNARRVNSLGLPANGGGSTTRIESVVGEGVLIDPVAVISRRIEVVQQEVETNKKLVDEASAALEDLTDEAQRLTKALKALVPAPATNGRRKNTSAQSRRRTPA